MADRPETTVAPQALLLMNNPHVREAARHFATRLLSIAANSREEAVRMAYMSAISRSPTTDELENALQFLQQQASSYSSADASASLAKALEDFCQILFCLNEFVYVE